MVSGDLQGLFERSREAGEFFYLPRFSAWREAFGDRFLLRPMIRPELYRGSVVDDFVRHTFATEDFSITASNQANESLDMVDLMRLKVLQARIQQSADRDLRRTVGWEFARILGTLPPPETKTKLRLHRSLAEEIRETYLSTDPADYLSASEIRSLTILSEFIFEMLKAPKVKWSSFLHNKRVLDVKKAKLS